jgi:hypothetical protein
MSGPIQSCPFDETRGSGIVPKSEKKTPDAGGSGGIKEL